MFLIASFSLFYPADPSWASTNWGVVLCIECSGIHRCSIVSQTVQPSWSHQDSPNFAWKSRILTNMRSRFWHLLFWNEFLWYLYKNTQQRLYRNCPLRTLEMAFQRIKIPTLSIGACSQTNIQLTPLALTWFVSDIIFRFYVLKRLESLVSPFMVVVINFTDFSWLLFVLGASVSMCQRCGP